MAETLHIDELTKRIAAPPQLYRRRSYSVVAVTQIVELELGFPMVNFSSKTIDVSKSYGQNATHQ
jgi:hypothetical protein